MRLPENLTVIESEAFAGIDAQEIFIPASVKEIESEAFKNCYDLKVIHFANGNITVADNFLSGCYNDLTIDAPANSTVAAREEIFRQYMCPALPDVNPTFGMPVSFIDDLWTGHTGTTQTVVDGT